MEFQAFNTWDEMMSAIDTARVAADGRVKNWQSMIMPGDHFVQTTDYGFLIYGQVLESDDKFYKTDEGRNYRLCRCFSVACPDGEMGDVHVSVISALISKTLFDSIRDKGWNLE